MHKASVEAGSTLQSKYDGETDSIRSVMLDQVLKARRADPKFMKTGGTKMLENNDSDASSMVGMDKSKKAKGAAD